MPVLSLNASVVSRGLPSVKTNSSLDRIGHSRADRTGSPDTFSQAAARLHPMRRSEAVHRVKEQSGAPNHTLRSKLSIPKDPGNRSARWPDWTAHLNLP